MDGADARRGCGRTVDGAQLVSLADPAMRIAVPEAATYIGAFRWPLYGATDAEMHVFVEADEYGLVERFYWIQFESIMDSHPDAAYDYPESNPQTVEMDGHTVHVLPGIMTAEVPWTATRRPAAARGWRCSACTTAAHDRSRSC